MSAPEFSRLERIDTIGAGERTAVISAEPAECTALAARFGLLSVTRLSATFDIKRDAAGIVARGTVSAAVVQACSVTDDPLPVTIAEEVALRFVTEQEAAAEEEIELDLDALDTMPYDGAAIDLGEAAAETMALGARSFPARPECGGGAPRGGRHQRGRGETGGRARRVEGVAGRRLSRRGTG